MATRSPRLVCFYMVKQIHFENLNKMVLDLLGGSESLAQSWWTSPNLGFDNATPFQSYKTDPQQVLDYLIQHLQY